MTAALRMPALSDPEDDFVTKRPRLITMSDTDRESTPTMAPDTDRGAERDTLPPDPVEEAGAARAAATMLPGAPSAPAPPEYWKAAYDKLVEIHEDQRKDRDGRQGRDDELVARLSAAAKQASDDNRENLTTALGEIARSVEGIGKQMLILEEADAQHDEGIAALERQFTELKEELLSLVDAATKSAADKIGKLEDELAKVKANGRPPTPAPTSPVEA